MSETGQEKSVVRTAGRGVIYITFAKAWFMLTGWALIYILPRVFKWSVDGDDEMGQALFGAYGIVFTGVSFINNGIITGTIQSVSKFTSADESQAGAIRKTVHVVPRLLAQLLANPPHVVDGRLFGCLRRWSHGVHSSASTNKSGVTIRGGIRPSLRHNVAKCVRLFGFAMCCTFQGRTFFHAK